MIHLGLSFSHQTRKYVLFLVGRVGSTYLTTLLNSHPNILALSEELYAFKEAGAQAQLDWSRRFLTPPAIGRNIVRGFNVKLIDLVDPDGFAQLLREKRCHIIHLQRRNSVKQVVSYFNGRRLHEKTGMWGLFDEANRPSAFYIDPVEFMETLQGVEFQIRKLEDYVDHLQLPTLRLFYEDMLQDESAFVARIFSFLNIPSKPLQGKTIKITSDDLREVILNFDELRARYVDTEHEAMFDEARVDRTT